MLLLQLDLNYPMLVDPFIKLIINSFSKSLIISQKILVKKHLVLLWLELDQVN